MAQSDKILSKDIVQEGLFDGLLKETKETIQEISALEQAFISLAKTLKKDLKNNPLKTGKDIRQANKDIQESVKVSTSLNEVKKAKLELEQEEIKLEEKKQAQQKKQQPLTDKEIKQAEVRKILEKQRLETLKALAVLESNKLGLEKKLVASNKLLVIQREKLNVADKNYARDLKDINSKIDKNNALINKNADQLKQQKINVGNYTRSIHSAITETGLFNGVLGNLIIALRGVLVANDAAATGAKRFSNILKASGIVALVALISGIVNIVKSSQSALNSLALTAAKVKDALAGLFGIETNYADTETAIQNLTKATREYNIALQELMLDEEDFRSISEDVTLSFEARNKSLADAIEKQRAIVALNVKHAKEELDILLNKQTLLGLNNEELDQLNDLQIKYNDALDKEKDLIEIDIPRALRKRKAEQLASEIALLIGKKTSAKAELTILEEKAKAENLQMSERKTALKDLEDEIKSNFNATIETFNKYSNVAITKADAQRLLLATSKEELSQDILFLKLNVAEQETLATIITKRQNQDVEFGQTKAKLLQDEIDLKNRLLEIDRQIEGIKAADIINDNEILLKKEQELTVQKELELQNDAFSRKKLDALIEQKDTEREVEDKILEQRKKDLDREKEDADNRIIEKKLEKSEETAELLKIQNQYDIDSKNLEEESLARSKERREQDVKDNIELHRLQAQILSQNAATLTNSLGEEIDKRSQRQQDAYDLELQHRQENIQLQQQLAADGLDNTLEFEKAQQAKTELARKDALEKAQKDKENLQLVEAYFNAYNNRMSKEGANPTLAASQALSDVLLAKGIARGLQFANEGNDMVEALPGQRAIEGKDSIPFMLAPKEAVIKAKSNIKHKGVATALNNDTFDKLYLPVNKVAEVTAKAEQTSMERAYKAMFVQENKEIVDILKKIEAKPTQIIEVDKLGNLIEIVTKNGLKQVTKHINSSRIG